MHCPKCGIQIIDDANFCHKCGQGLRGIPAFKGDDIGVGNLDRSKGVAMGEGSKAEVNEIGEQRIEAQRPPGRDISLLWGCYRASIFLCIGALIPTFLIWAWLSLVEYNPSWGANNISQEMIERLERFHSMPPPLFIALALLLPVLIYLHFRLNRHIERKRQSVSSKEQLWRL